MPAPNRPATPGGAREFYFEFISAGHQVKVSAIDSWTGIEVCIIAPAGATREHMQAVAMAKLERQLARQTQREGR